MLSARRMHYSYEDYVVFEHHSSAKHEYCDGEIYAMAGGTPEHGALCVEVASQLRRQFPTCTVFSSDVRVRIAASDLSTYPDVSVVCGKVERDAVDQVAITNPSVIVEVTSPSTVDYDRGAKLSHYTQLPSVTTIVFVAHHTRCLTVVQRTSRGWETTEFRSGSQAVAASPAFSLDVDAVYGVLDRM